MYDFQHSKRERNAFEPLQRDNNPKLFLENETTVNICSQCVVTHVTFSYNDRSPVSKNFTLIRERLITTVFSSGDINGLLSLAFCGRQ